MTQNPNPALQKLGTPSIVLLTPKETAGRLKVSTSWLAKARMTGDGPPFIKIGRSIRYIEAALLQWMKSRQRLFSNEAKRARPSAESSAVITVHHNTSQYIDKNEEVTVLGITMEVYVSYILLTSS